MEEIKGVELLPQTGILQFFLFSDVECGCDFDDYTNNDRFRVIYHPTVDPAVSEQDVLSLEISTSIKKYSDDDVISGEIGIDFEVSKMAAPNYGEFNKKFIELAEKQGWNIDYDEKKTFIF